ncbi:MAG: UDP-N-acetylglucosamine 1-carboxyvinyltransferase [Eubacteriales bacterium]
MKKIFVRKSPALCGDVFISASKNAILPILAATLLTDRPVTIKNIPLLDDVNAMFNILSGMGSKIYMSGRDFTIDNSKINIYEPYYKSTGALRASILILGPAISRFGSVRIKMPGGCPIGKRPIDMHLNGLSCLGMRYVFKESFLDARAARLCGADISLPYASVGATENILCASVLAKGKTTIKNAAREPEIVDLSNFLIALGADISGAGTSTITINGVKSLESAIYTPIPDRIEAGTFVAASMITNGHITVKNVHSGDMKATLDTFYKMGANLVENPDNSLTISMREDLRPVDVRCMPYPEFPTDMQPIFMSLACAANGVSTICETVFENRFMHAFELCKMKADISINGRIATIKGGKLFGQKVAATDLRAASALTIAGLYASGVTEISNAQFLTRGYENFDVKLRSLGARIRCV